MGIKEQLKQPGQGKPISGHDLMALERFAEDTRHMIVFDALTHKCPVGGKGERVRMFLTDEGYQQAINSEASGEMKIITYARVHKGQLWYSTKERDGL